MCSKRQKSDLDAFRNVRRPAKTFGNPDFDVFFGAQGAKTKRGSRFGGQDALDFAVFIPGPQQGGHAAGGRSFGGLGKAINAAENAEPFTVFDVVEMDAVGISGFDGLRGREATMLLLRQFPQFESQFF